MNTNVTSSWNASLRLAVSRPLQQASLKKTIQAYKALSHRLKTKLEQLTQKRDELDSKAFVMVQESPTTQATSPTTAGYKDTPLSSPEIQPAPQMRLKESGYHHTVTDLSSLASTVTNILIESVEIKLSYITEAISYLTNLYRENPKQRMPAELRLSRYEEWVQTNQRLFELNSRLYDLEKVKFDLERRMAANEQEADKKADRDEFDNTGAY